MIDGLAFGVMAEEAALLRERNPLVALVHHPLALETGLDAATAEALRDSERAALACTRAVIVTSEPTAEILCRDYGVPASALPSFGQVSMFRQARRSSSRQTTW